MPTDTRDRRATEVVTCPRCGAPPGTLCYQTARALRLNPGRPLTHTERRQAYRDRIAIKEQEHAT
jgi:hypothetical protein